MNTKNHKVFPHQIISYILINYDMQTTDKLIVQLQQVGFKLLKIRISILSNNNNNTQNIPFKCQHHISNHISKNQLSNINIFQQAIKTKYQFLNIKVSSSSNYLIITINNLYNSQFLKADLKQYEQKVRHQLLLYSVYFKKVNFRLVNLDSSSLVVNSNYIQQQNISSQDRNILKYRSCSQLLKVNLLDIIHCMFKIENIKIQLIMTRSQLGNDDSYVIGFVNGMKSNNKHLQLVINIIYLNQYILNGDKQKYRVYFNITSVNNGIIKDNIFDKLSQNIQLYLRKREKIKIFNQNKQFVNIPKEIFYKIFPKLNTKKEVQTPNSNKQLQFEVEQEIDSQNLLSFSCIRFNCILEVNNYSQQILKQTKQFFQKSQIVCHLLYYKLLVINKNMMYLVNFKCFIQSIFLSYLKQTKTLNYLTFTKTIFVQQILTHLSKQKPLLKFNVKQYSKLIVDFRNIIMQYTKIVIQGTGQIKCIPYPHQQLRDVNILRFGLFIAKIAYYINNNKTIQQKVLQTYLIEYFTSLKYQIGNIDKNHSFINFIWNHLKQGIKIPKSQQQRWKQPLQDMKYLLKQFGRC